MTNLFRTANCFVFIIFLVAGCAPVVYAPLPPDTPLYYPTDYASLFDATLRALTTSYVETYGGERLTFAITAAERDTGLIRAVHQELRELTTLERYPKPDNADELWFVFPLEETRVYRVQTTVTLVLHPEGDGVASLAYSTTDSLGTSSNLANAYMAKVIDKLDAQFLDKLPDGNGAALPTNVIAAR